jgi:hypothetical protein
MTRPSVCSAWYSCSGSEACSCSPPGGASAAGLRHRTDERINAIDRSASLTAGMVGLITVLVMFVLEIAQGEEGSPYSELGALGGLSYVASLAWLRYSR